MYRYIALPHTDGANGGDVAVLDRLRQAGLDNAQALASHTVIVAPGTPLLHIRPNAVLVGHVFWRSSGTPVGDSGGFENVEFERLVNRLIEECWGEYILLHDGDGGALSALRDPSGGAGCYYSCEGGFVTSDVSLAIRAGIHGGSIDWDFISETLVYPHLKTGRTGLSGVQELLPGRVLNILDRRAATAESWTPWDFVAAHQRYRHPRDAQEDVRQVVSSAVRTWAETDRTLLLELSGGLDSSIVAACLLEADSEVNCCNLVTPVPGADERRYARLMSDLLGCEIHVRSLRIEDAEFEFPPPSHAAVPSTWFLQHASNRLKETIGRQLDVSSYFSGGGGDTVFGYTKTAAPAADAFRERGFRASIRTIRDLAELHQCTVWKVARLAARKLRGPPKPPRIPDHSFLRHAIDLDASTLHPWFDAPAGALAGDRERIFDLAGNQGFRDGAARGGGRHLRMPLLSQPVMEACLKVPTWMWFTGGRNRAVARDAFADLLPPGILYRRSKGTFMNYSGAVYRRNRHRLRDYLLAGELSGRGLLDTDALHAFFNQNPDTQGDAFMRIFDLCEVENWVRHQARTQH